MLFKNFIFSFIIVLLLVSNSVCKADTRNIVKMGITSYNINNQIYTETVTSQQLKSQIKFFKEALDQFGATSPKQVIELWIKGFEERNGVLQYSVFCDKLKDKFVKNLGEASNSFWIIGGSSPSLQKYEIVSNKRLSDSAYEITVKLTWVATKYKKSEKMTLIIVKEKCKWCIEDIR
jgi:hypothetical protein